MFRNSFCIVFKDKNVRNPALEASIPRLTLHQVQQSPLGAGEKKPIRPTHLNLSLQDLLNHPEDVALTSSKASLSSVGPEKNELLSTPEGPEASSTIEDLKIHELLSFPAETQLQEHPDPVPTLISPRNAELLIPNKVTTISNSTTAGTL